MLTWSLRVREPLNSGNETVNEICIFFQRPQVRHFRCADAIPRQQFWLLQTIDLIGNCEKHSNPIKSMQPP